MSKHELVPAYYDGQDHRTEPVFLKPRHEIKSLRKSGDLNGWYQENGNVFIVYRQQCIDLDSLEIVAGSGFDSAWTIRQSGYAGPNTWQLKTGREAVSI